MDELNKYLLGNWLNYPFLASKSICCVYTWELPQILCDYGSIFVKSLILSPSPPANWKTLNSFSLNTVSIFSGCDLLCVAVKSYEWKFFFSSRGKMKSLMEFKYSRRERERWKKFFLLHQKVFLTKNFSIFFFAPRTSNVSRMEMK